MKTQTQIRERFDSITPSSDPLAFRREVLVECMEFDTVKDLLKSEATQEDWDTPDPATAARKYLVFALGKALGHRGISAGRSVEKMSEYLWVLDEDTLAERFENAGYANYGAPKLLVLANAWKIDDPVLHDPRFARMSQGQPCQFDCLEGCGVG